MIIHLPSSRNDKGTSYQTYSPSGFRAKMSLKLLLILSFDRFDQAQDVY